MGIFSVNINPYHEWLVFASCLDAAIVHLGLHNATEYYQLACMGCISYRGGAVRGDVLCNHAEFFVISPQHRCNEVE